MKSKLLVILSTLVLALNMMALDRNAGFSQAKATATDSKTAACCDQGKTPDGKAACVKGAGCCGKDVKCCGSEMASKDGKAAKACPMTSKGNDGKSTCCTDGKCPMMAKGNGKSCCGDGGCSGKPAAVAAPSTQSKATCCSKGAACCADGGICCGGQASA